jgi:hypothetical protein
MSLTTSFVLAWPSARDWFGDDADVPIVSDRGVPTIASPRGSRSSREIVEREVRREASA